MSNGLSKVNCLAGICCDGVAAKRALRSFLIEDLGCSNDVAAHLADKMREHDVTFLPGSVAREIAKLAAHPGRSESTDLEARQLASRRAAIEALAGLQHTLKAAGRLLYDGDRPELQKRINDMNSALSKVLPGLLAEVNAELGETPPHAPFDDLPGGQ